MGLMFKNTLQQIYTKIEGALGVMIVAHDGVIVEQVSHSPDFNLELLGAEFAALLKGTQRFCGGTDLGDVEEMTIQTNQARILARFITSEYYLLLVLSSRASAGRAQHELRKAQLLLEGEFTV